ncbi:MAG: hypothetical protein ACRDD8_05660 [Bacteroidales bacterium]
MKYEDGLQLIIDKVEGVSEKSWQDIVDDLGLKMNKNTLRNAVNVGPYSGYNVAMYYKAKTMENSTEAELEEIRVAKDELYKERVRLQDQKREYKAYLRLEARFEHLLGEMVRAIQETKEEPFMDDYIDLGEERLGCASLILSDWHIGMTIDDDLNVYNNKVANRRLQKLRDKIIKLVKLHGVYELNIELLGDLIQGYLHCGSRVENEEDVISQTIRCSEMIAEFINDLASYVPKINVYSCIGNHGRTNANLKDSLQVENFERMITWYLSTRLKNENVCIKDCQIDYIQYKNMNGIDIVSAHGNLDKPNQIVNNFIKMYKYTPQEFHLGHTHFYQENDEYDINVVVNGTLSGMDSFAKSIRKTSEPCQVFRVYDNDVCTYKLKLY